MLEALNYVRNAVQPFGLHRELTKTFPSEPAVGAANYVASMLDWHYFRL